jgi:hypothetical protein
MTDLIGSDKRMTDIRRIGTLLRTKGHLMFITDRTFLQHLFVIIYIRLDLE